jgi:hypothetical protein
MRRYAILPAAILCLGMKCDSAKPTPEPTPTPVVGGPDCGTFAGVGALCLAYNVACPSGLVDRGATYDCQRCCGTPVAPTPTPSQTATPEPKPTPWASFPENGTAAYFCCCGWEREGLGQLASYCAPWSTHIRIDPWDMMRGTDLDRVAAMTADKDAGRIGVDPYLRQATEQLGKRLIVGLLWTPGLTALQSFAAGSSAMKSERVPTDFGYYGKILRGPARSMGFAFSGDAMVCNDPQAPDILRKYAPYADKIGAVEVVDEPNYTFDEMSCVLSSVDAALTQVAMPMLPRMVMFTKDQLQYGNAWRALDPQRDVLGFEVYVDPEMKTEAQIRAQIRKTFFDQYRPTAPYKIQIAGDGYTRNYSVTDTRVIRIAQDETTKCVMEVKADKRIVLVVWFSYMRPSGIRDELDNYGTQHMLSGAECLRWTLDGHPERCAQVPKLPTPAPTPEPNAPGSVGYDQGSCGVPEGSPCQISFKRDHAGGASGCQVAHWIAEQTRGTGFATQRGTVELCGQTGWAPLVLTLPRDPSPTGVRQLRIGIESVDGGATHEPGKAWMAWWSTACCSITWQGLDNLPGQNPRLWRMGGDNSVPLTVQLGARSETIKAGEAIHPVLDLPRGTSVTITSAPGYTIVDPVAQVR